MMIVEPVLTLIAFNHEFIHIIKRVRFLAITIAIKVVLVVVILLVFIILFLIIQFACQWHSTISTIASKINFRVKLDAIMICMTMVHTSKAKTMRFNEIYELTILSLTRLYQKSFFIWKFLYHILVASQAGKHLLINVAVFVSTTVYLLYINDLIEKNLLFLINCCLSFSSFSLSRIN
jgi:hypothetical protein